MGIPTTAPEKIGQVAHLQFVDEERYQVLDAGRHVEELHTLHHLLSLLPRSFGSVLQTFSKPVLTGLVNDVPKEVELGFDSCVQPFLQDLD